VYRETQVDYSHRHKQDWNNLFTKTFKSANCASTLARLREMGISPNVDAVVSAFKHNRGSLALGSHLRAELLADRKDDLTAAKFRYGLEFSDEMPEEQTDPLEGPSPTSLLQASAAFVSKKTQQRGRMP